MKLLRWRRALACIVPVCACPLALNTSVSPGIDMPSAKHREGFGSTRMPRRHSHHDPLGLGGTEKSTGETAGGHTRWPRRSVIDCNNLAIAQERWTSGPYGRLEPDKGRRYSRFCNVGSRRYRRIKEKSGIAACSYSLHECDDIAELQWSAGAPAAPLRAASSNDRFRRVLNRISRSA